MTKTRLYKIVTATGRELWLGRATETRIQQLVAHYRRWHPTAQAVPLAAEEEE